MIGIKNYFKILLVVMFTLFSSCEFKNTSKENNRQIIFGVSPFPDTQMPILGKLKGWYAEEGLDVKFKILGWTEIQEALSSNSSTRIDIGINNISSIIATNNKNPDLIYYYGFNTFDNGFALMIRPDKSLKPLKFFMEKYNSPEIAIEQCCNQLKGKTVITTSNTDMEQGVAACARKGKLNFLSDLKIIDLHPDEGLAAFLQGSGDAYIGGIPQRIKADQEGMIEMITGSNLGPAPINGIVTTKKFANENAEALSKILKVWFKIVKYTNSHIDEVADIMVTELNKNTAASITTEQFKIFWNNYEHYPDSPSSIEREILSPTGKNYWKYRWDDCNHYFYKIKKSISKPVDENDAFYMISAHDRLNKYLKYDNN